jgi:hypothetical protein
MRTMRAATLKPRLTIGRPVEKQPLQNEWTPKMKWTIGKLSLVALICGAVGFFLPSISWVSSRLLPLWIAGGIEFAA